MKAIKECVICNNLNDTKQKYCRECWAKICKQRSDSE